MPRAYLKTEPWFFFMKWKVPLPWYEVAWPVTVMILLTAVFLVRSRNSELELQIEYYEPVIRRVVGEDGLIGQKLSQPALSFLSALEGRPGAPGRWRAIWVTRPEECRDCEDLSAWQALSRNPNIDTILIISGKLGLDFRAQPPLNRDHSAVLIDSLKIVEGELGTVGPSAKMLLNERGKILLADLRRNRNRCGWSFEAQVEALLPQWKGEHVLSADETGRS